LGRYPVNPAATTIYVVPVLLMSIGMSLQWEWAESRGLLAADVAPALAAGIRRRSRFAPLFIAIMFCLLAGRIAPWAYAPIALLLPAILLIRFRSKQVTGTSSSRSESR
jgi:hypothetical protein